ncbi:DUF2142 domain-containing protein [Fibrella sp. WM1]|uniref:DUF2142 domain-containing protein n=1 Tax=Fibrella musci TaxID=3242485 RepID=UPI0035210F9D
MVAIKSRPSIEVIVEKEVPKSQRWSLETSFLLIGFFFGVLFLATTPPFQVADESRHFVRAYQISEDVLHALGWIPSSDQLPVSLVNAIQETQYLHVDPDSKTTISHTLSLMDDELRPNARVRYVDTAAYPFISYLPQLILIIPLRLLQVNAVVTLYAARFCALLFWLLVTYLAIRKLPVAKHLLVFIALLPMTIFQAGSLSADCITLSLSFLLIAYYVHLAHKASYVRSNEFLVVSGVGALLTAAKLVYFPLVGLHFLISPSKFRSRRIYILTFALTVVVCIATLLLSYNNFLTPLFSPEKTVAVTGVMGPTSYPQLNFLLADPLNIGRMLAATGGKYGRTYMDGFVGHLGWSCASLPSYLYVVTILMIAITAFTVDGRLFRRRWHRVLLIGIAVIISAAICIAICTDTFLNYTPTFFLRGIQGRYFTPFAMLIGLVAANRTAFSRRYGRYVQAAMLPFVIFLLLNAVYILVDHYYVL